MRVYTLINACTLTYTCSRTHIYFQGYVEFEIICEPIHFNIYIYIYIYIEREREKEREGEKERETILVRNLPAETE